MSGTSSPTTTSTPRSDSGEEATAAGASSSPRRRFELTDALDEIESRFLLNLPEEELASVERLFFQLEQAHWYYEDFLADEHENLPHFQLEGFTQALFTHSELLQHLQERHADLVRDFHTYKYAVPVYGCVLLSPAMDKILLVCNWERTVWGLPRGKINEGEQPIDCAARETYEECGYDVSGRLTEADSFTMVQNAKRIKMFIVLDVPEDFPFKPQVRKEVSEVRFFPLDALPTKSYNVTHSVAHVRHWMKRREKAAAKKGKQRGGKGRGGSQPSIAREVHTLSAQRKGGKDISVTQQQFSPSSRSNSSGRNGRARSAPDSRVVEHPSDLNNVATFGATAGDSWGVDAMFKANEKLTGKKFTYDGNPHRFGDYEPVPHKSAAGGRYATSTGERVPSCTRLDEIEGRHGGQEQHQKKKAPASSKLPPAVASLMNHGAVISSKSAISSSSSTTNGNASSSTMIYSCASLEAQVAKDGGGGGGGSLQVVSTEKVVESGLDSLSNFSFDTQDILSALHF